MRTIDIENAIRYEFRDDIQRYIAETNSDGVMLMQIRAGIRSIEMVVIESDQVGEIDLKETNAFDSDRESRALMIMSANEDSANTGYDMVVINKNEEPVGIRVFVDGLFMYWSVQDGRVDS